MSECSYSHANVQWNAAPERHAGLENWDVDDLSLAVVTFMTDFRGTWENVPEAEVWVERGDLSQPVIVLSPSICPIDGPRGAGVALLDAQWGWNSPVEVLRPISRDWATRSLRGRSHCCLYSPVILRHLAFPGGAARAVHVPAEAVPDLSKLQGRYPSHLPAVPAQTVGGEEVDRLTPVGALLGTPTHILWGFDDGTPCGWEEVPSLGAATARWKVRGSQRLLGLGDDGIREFDFTNPARLAKVRALADFYATARDAYRQGLAVAR